MPRGNASLEVERENASRFGDHLNAADLIRVNNASYDPGVQKVLGTATNEEETAKVLASLRSYAGRFDLRDGETLVSAAVHGGALVGVIRGRDGRDRKAVAPYEDGWEAPELSPDEQAQAKRAQAESEVAQETNRIREEAGERVRRAAEEAQAEADAAIAKIREEADARIAKAREEADKAADSPEPKAAPAATDPQDEAPPTAKQLEKANNRDELNALASKAGVADPDKLESKAAVAEAIVAARQ